MKAVLPFESFVRRADDVVNERAGAASAAGPAVEHKVKRRSVLSTPTPPPGTVHEKKRGGPPHTAGKELQSGAEAVTAMDGSATSAALAAGALPWLMRHIRSPADVLHVLVPPQRVPLREETDVAYGTALQSVAGAAGMKREKPASGPAATTIRDIPLTCAPPQFDLNPSASQSGKNETVSGTPNEVPFALRYASTSPAGREEVAQLQVKMDRTLLALHAKDQGICPLRSMVYRDVVNELIRQLTLEEPARGLLLVRIRDDYERTLSVHEKLLERALSFGAKTMMMDRQTPTTTDSHPNIRSSANSNSKNSSRTQAPLLGKQLITDSRESGATSAHSASRSNNANTSGESRLDEARGHKGCTVDNDSDTECQTSTENRLIARLKSENADLEERVREKALHVERLRKLSRAQLEVEARQRGEEAAFYRKTNQQLSQHLKQHMEQWSLGKSDAAPGNSTAA